MREHITNKASADDLGLTTLSARQNMNIINRGMIQADFRVYGSTTANETSIQMLTCGEWSMTVFWV